VKDNGDATAHTSPNIHPVSRAETVSSPDMWGLVYFSLCGGGCALHGHHQLSGVHLDFGFTCSGLRYSSTAKISRLKLQQWNVKHTMQNSFRITLITYKR
jgi:hypothetical protein